MYTNEIWEPEDKGFIPSGYRVKWVYDECYQSEGSYALDTEEETQEAVDVERSKLESGEWYALGYIVQEMCDKCGEWIDLDSLWGIVIPDTQEDKESMFDYPFKE